MIRMLGVLAGAAIAVALLILLVGVPEFPDAPTPDPVVAAAEEQPAPVSTTASQPAGMSLEVETEPEPQPEPVPETPPEPDPAPVPAPSLTTHWYAFWSPFRSEIAASGFVAKLQEKTGIDYRVVKVKTGVYEVAFAYTDDADIQSKLERITTATGLDVSGG